MTRRMSYGEHFDACALPAAANLVKLGVSVAFVKSSHVGSVGVFDSIAGHHGYTHGLEWKSLGGKLEESQVAFLRRWNGCAHVATNSDEAHRLILECEAKRARSVRPIALSPHREAVILAADRAVDALSEMPAFLGHAPEFRALKEAILELRAARSVEIR